MPEEAPRPDRTFAAATLAVTAAAAVRVAFAHRESVNPDGIAYLLNAGHWARGEWGLAVNGYWGPLFSWLAAPLLAAGVEPLLAAHLVAALAAVVFTAGAHAVLAATLPDRTVVRVGTVLAAAAALAWSAATVTPDLLVGGLFALGAAALLRTGPEGGVRAAFAAGLWLGAACLAKAVALPGGFLLVAAVALVRARAAGPEGRGAQLRWAAAAAAGALAVALPWIVVLSVHHGRPTFSTTGAIAHAVLGPADVDRWYPTFRTFHDPGPGRITSWEDPAALRYEFWSPFASTGLLRHQVRVVLNNAAAIADFVRGLDFLAIGLASTGIGLALLAASRSVAVADRWRLASVGTLVVCAPYLPVFCDAERYYWPALPFLLATAFGLAGHVTAPAAPAVRRSVLGAVAASFALGTLAFDIPGFPHSVPERPGLVEALRGRPDPRTVASRRLAGSLVREGAAGPVWSDCREGLYVAFFAGVPWHGQEDAPTAERLRAAGSTLVVTRRGSPLAAALEARDDWRPVAEAPGAALRAFARSAP